MSNAKEIRGQIKSIGNTKKITKAMEMVAASKVRRAQEYMRAGRPYADQILSVIAHLVKASSSANHPFLKKSAKVSKVGYIIVASDRGLCGGLNINLFKALMESIKEEREAGHEITCSVFGRKGVSFARRVGLDMMTAVEGYAEHPKVQDLIGGIQPMLTAFENGEIQKVYLVSNSFVNAMQQKPQVQHLLPAGIEHADNATPSHSWDYLYDPSPEVILDRLLNRYFESIVKQAVVENIACEMSARMVAMKNATDNAGSLIKELQLQYNKARQAAITAEINEIVAGADAV